MKTEFGKEQNGIHQALVVVFTTSATGFQDCCLYTGARTVVQLNGLLELIIAAQLNCSCQCADCFSHIMPRYRVLVI